LGAAWRRDTLPGSIYEDRAGRLARCREPQNDPDPPITAVTHVQRDRRRLDFSAPSSRIRQEGAAASSAEQHTERPRAVSARP